MIAPLFRRRKSVPSDLHTSQLHNEKTFYRAFMRDLHSCTSEAIIESPFIIFGLS